MILLKEQELFELWAQHRKEFSPDGIVDLESYLKSRFKVVILLKETNNKQRKSVNLKKLLSNPGFSRRPTWDNVSRWVYGIQNLDKDLHWGFLGKRESIDYVRHECLKQICVINLKKSPGGHTSDKLEIERISEEDEKFLNQQVNLYFDNIVTKPDFIICGGSDTSNIFNSIVDIKGDNPWRTTKRGIPYFEFDKNRFFIKYCHPNARVSDNLLYYGLIDSIKELHENKRC